MALLQWLGLVSLRRFRALEDTCRELRNERTAQLEQIRDLKAALITAKEKHTDVAVMLDEAMETVTSAVGFAAILDAAKRKLEEMQDQVPVVASAVSPLPDPDRL